MSRTLSKGLEAFLEIAELMVKPVESHTSVHTLLHPKNLGVGSAAAVPESLGFEDDDEQTMYLFWDSLEPEVVDASTTWPALWGLLRLKNAPDEEIRAFTERWGMLDADWDGDGYGDLFRNDYGEFHEGAIALESWRQFAEVVSQLLTLLVLTWNDQMLDREMLEAIQDWEELPDVPGFEPDDFAAFNGGASELLAERELRRRQQRLDNLLKERRDGLGIEQQRRLLTQKLNNLLGMQYASFSWDERGRRIEREATGLADIVFSHIASLFLSPEVDVLVCSVCGTPFPFDEATHERRPRHGARRFCSEACRKEAKRESNRLSWRRNSPRWRRNPPPDRGTNKGEQFGQEG